MSSTREPRVAVVGATGAVGNEIVELIAARGFPYSHLGLFASQSGAAGTVETSEDEYLVESLRDPEDLAGFDIAFLAVPEGVATEITRALPGPLLIDLSGANRSPSRDVPMVAPGVTSRAQVAQLSSARILTIPHPVAHVMTLCLDAIKPQIVAATAMTGGSAGGRSAIARIVDQTTELLSARLDLEEEEIQRAFNAFTRETERALADRIVAQAAAMTRSTLQRAIVDLATRARSRQLKPDEVQGGTFSITNFGSFGSLMGTPIINQPQVAIMGVGTVDKTPVVIDDAIAIRSIFHLSLSFDHRLVDGALADQFMTKAKQVLEDWSEEVL